TMPSTSTPRVGSGPSVAGSTPASSATASSPITVRLTPTELPMTSPFSLSNMRLLPGLLALAFACDTEAPACPTAAGTICTFAGDGEAGFNGDDEPLSAARFYWPADVTITSTGELYILDWNNHQVRLLTDDGNLKTVLGTDFVGDGPFDLSDLSAPGSDGTEVHLNHPTQLLEEPGGTLLLVSWHNHKLRRYDPKTGKAIVIIGRGAGFAGDGGPIGDPDARLNQPSGGVLDPDGNLYLLDQRNQRIRLLAA